MVNMYITIQTILAICGGISCIGGVFALVVKALTPWKTLIKRVDVLEEKIKNDYENINEIETSLRSVENSNKVICKSLLVILNHEATGEGLEEIKEQRNTLEQFIIDSK